MSELKPCPFCGGEGYIDTYAGEMNFKTVVCKHCGARGPYLERSDEKQAIAAWNSRATSGLTGQAKLEGKLKERLAMLPLKPDDIVWALEYQVNRSVCIAKRVISSIEILSDGLIWIHTGNKSGFVEKCIGKQIFFTREEAETALASQEKKQP